MTSRERINAALSHKEPDRTPIFEYVLQPPVADAILGRKYIYGKRFQEYIEENGWERALRQQAKDMIDIAVNLGHDMLYATPNPLPPEKTKENRTNLEIRSSDPIENIRSRIKRMKQDNNSDIPDEKFFIYLFLKKEMNKREMDIPILAPACVHGIWTDIDLMQTLILEPLIAKEFFSLKTENCISLIKKYIECEIDMITVGGDFAGNKGPLISPVHYRKFILPELKKVSSFIHSFGKIAVNASDGNLWPLIDDFLISSEVDGYIEIDLRAGMHLKKLKKEYGDRITFFGNLDCANILSFGTPNEIKQHTIKCLTDGMPNGGHVLCCNNAITESVPLKNYLAIYEAYKDFFGI